MGGETKQVADPKYTKTPAAQMSRPFLVRYKVVEYSRPIDREVGEYDPPRTKRVYDPTRPNIGSDSGGYHDDPLPPDWIREATRAVKSRWLYVFQKLGDKITWFGEFWVDDQGGYHPVDMGKAKDKE